MIVDDSGGQNLFDVLNRLEPNPNPGRRGTFVYIAANK